ncbi:hypothetical protein K438DRAFT_1814742 [Mycena galopus ATCC 62051]|nr:hypothetical protein K438DRAFT_1814742 [Mycena galopus ATCC 62051]
MSLCVVYIPHRMASSPLCDVRRAYAYFSLWCSGSGSGSIASWCVVSLDAPRWRREQCRCRRRCQSRRWLLSIRLVRVAPRPSAYITRAMGRVRFHITQLWPGHTSHSRRGAREALSLLYSTLCIAFPAPAARACFCWLSALLGSGSTYRRRRPASGAASCGVTTLNTTTASASVSCRRHACMHICSVALLGRRRSQSPSLPF